MDKPYQQHRLFEIIGSDTIVLTPNRRLAATLHKLYREYQQQLDISAWVTPEIIPINSWITKLWEDYHAEHIGDAPFLLNSAQEQYLWEKIIAATKQGEQLLQVSETADLVMAAWKLLKQWQIDFKHGLFSSAEDYLALQMWAQEFAATCAKQNWVDQASIVDIVIYLLTNKNINTHRKIIIFGITEIAPQFQALLDACKLNGSQIELMAFVQEETNCKRISAPNSEQEIFTMARWAKSIWLQNSTARIACVIPGLDLQRDRVAQMFGEVFAEQQHYTVDLQATCFNISAGKQLIQYPLIQTALQLLALEKNTIATELFSYLLGSPYVGDADSERIKRANFDSLLRRNNVITVNIANLINHQDDKQKIALHKQCPKLFRRLREFDNYKKNLHEIYSLQQWSLIFTDLLSLLGWPGERSLNSVEFQIVESWLNLLTEYSRLDIVCQPVKYQTALHLLQKFAQNTIFQAKSPEAAIQVLGVLEAAALPFDYIWVSGLDDIAWPPQPKPNPFIPKKLQRDLQMPHATAERELFFCNTLLRQFKECGNHLIVSHAEKNEELELQPSALIRDIPAVLLEELQLESYQSPAQRIFQTQQLEIVLDAIGPAVKTNDKIRGGVSVIKTQAMCPFKAFAEWRLHAHELERPLPGLRAKDRGTLIHKALELLWAELKDSETLNSLADSELDKIILGSIEAAISSIPQSHSELSQYINLEKQRLAKVLHEWLVFEKSRPSFKVVSNEKSIAYTLGKLALTLRVDRIDELECGKQLIVDYKTGKNNDVGDWFGERLEEPQLPLYTLIQSSNISGITFAQICPGEYSFKGISHADIAIKGIRAISEVKKAEGAEWNTQIHSWQKNLTHLSDNFVNGVANVDPKDALQTCNYCALKPLCRINEEIHRC